MLVVPNVGAITLQQILNDNWGVWIHLYMADVPLDRATVLSDLVELDVPGYAPQAAMGWLDPEIVEGRAQTGADPILFTRESGLPQRDVWGYYATMGMSGPLLWVERALDPPIPFRVSTDNWTVIPRFNGAGRVKRSNAGP